MKYFPRVSWLVVAGLLMGCTGDDGNPRVKVTVKVSICADEGADCYSLGVPQAKVELKASDGSVAANATTDDAGVAWFEVPDGFAGGAVVAQSALLEGGRATAPLMSPSPDNAITMMGKLASDTNTPISPQVSAS